MTASAPDQDALAEFLRGRAVLSPLRYPGGKRRLVPTWPQRCKSLAGPARTTAEVIDSMNATTRPAPVRSLITAAVVDETLLR